MAVSGNRIGGSLEIHRDNWVEIIGVVVDPK